MNFLHEELDLEAGDLVEVSLEGKANVMLLDPRNFACYEQGLSYRYHGGYADESPILLPAPHAGKWHVVVNLGGFPGRVRAGVRVLREEGALSTR